MKRTKKIIRMTSTLLAFILILCTLSTNISADILQEDTVQIYYPVLYDSAESGTEVLDKSIDTVELRNYLIEQFAAFASHIDISKYEISNTTENRQAIMEFIWHEIPEAFHVHGVGTDSRNNCVSVVYVTYYDWCSAEKYPEMYSELQSATSYLLDGIENNDFLTDVEKTLLIHDRLAVWNEYDYSNYLSGTIPGESYTAYGALVKRTSVCEGYTEAYMYLLNCVGIKNIYCSSDELNHAWNIVYINNTPYHVDVTWDDLDATGWVSHNNFLVSSDLLYNQGHTASDYDTSPQDTRYDNQYWRNSQTEFQLIDNTLYFIDNNSSTLNQIKNGITTELISVDDEWTAGWGSTWRGNFSKLSSDGSNLLLSLSDAVYEFNISNKSLDAVFHPDLTVGNYFSIYGFTYSDGYLICDLNDSPSFSSDTKELYQVKQLYHNFGEWVETLAPTCTKAGTERRDCKDCDHHETRKIIAFGHDYETKWTVDTPATETTTGSKSHHCKRCGDKTHITVIPVKVLVTTQFKDVVPGEWYESAVQYAVDNSLFFGVSDNEFAPDVAMNRAMLVTVLWRLEEKPTTWEENKFIDVPANEWYTNAVTWASENGVVYGMDEFEFLPEDNITREQLAAILYRYANKKGYDITASTDLNTFPDSSDASSYAREALSWACGAGLIFGSDGKLLPQDGATRAQVAAILMRYTQKIVK